MTTPQLDRLRAACRRWRLYQIEAELGTVLEQAAKREVSYADFLDEVLGREVGAKTQKRLATRIAMARFRFQKTLERFDFSRVYRHPRGSAGARFEAVEPLRQGVHAIFGAYADGIATGLQARDGHGSQYHERLLPGRAALSRDCIQPDVRPGTRGQRRRRALHPYAQEQLLGCERSTPSRNSSRCCSSSKSGITASGSANGTGIRHRPPSERERLDAAA